MLEFCQCNVGRMFFDVTIPRIAQDFERIADALEALVEAKEQTEKGDSIEKN